MICLYDDKSALPVNERGKSPMQPVCAKRLRVGHGRLITGVKGDDIETVRAALEEIVPLLACQFRNDMLPCAHACERATDAVGAEFQELARRGGTVERTPQTPPPGRASEAAGVPPK